MRLTPPQEKALRVLASLTEHESGQQYGTSAGFVAGRMGWPPRRQRGPGAGPMNAARLLSKLTDLGLASSWCESDHYAARWRVTPAGREWLRQNPPGGR